jgi:hypothetical protein
MSDVVPLRRTCEKLCIDNVNADENVDLTRDNVKMCKKACDLQVIDCSSMCSPPARQADSRTPPQNTQMTHSCVLGCHGGRKMFHRDNAPDTLPLG